MGDDQEDEELFLPLRLFYGGRSFSPRDRREWHHERVIAERVNRHREQWEGRGRGRAGRRAGCAGSAGRTSSMSAVAIADAEGTEAVSMRRIARDLRVGAMSLYWHVESKEELHQLMLDTVQAEIEAPRPVRRLANGPGGLREQHQGGAAAAPVGDRFPQHRPAVRPQRRAQRRAADRVAERARP